MITFFSIMAILAKYFYIQFPNSTLNYWMWTFAFCALLAMIFSLDNTYRERTRKSKYLLMVDCSFSLLIGISSTFLG